MDRKGIAPLVIVAVAVVAVAVVGVGAYVALSGGTGTSTTTTSASVADATSLRFKIEMTYQGISAAGTFMIKGIGSSDVKMRVDLTAAGEDAIIVIDGAQRTAWAYQGGQWMDASSEFEQYWEQWDQTFELAKNQLGDLTGGDYTFTTSSMAFRIYDVEVNPSLADSLFQHG